MNYCQTLLLFGVMGPRYRTVRLEDRRAGRGDRRARALSHLRDQTRLIGSADIRFASAQVVRAMRNYLSRNGNTTVIRPFQSHTQSVYTRW